MIFVECYDLVSENRVYVNPLSVSYVAEVPIEYQTDIQNKTGSKVTIPKGAYQVMLNVGKIIAVDAASGEKLVNYVPPPVYALDAKTLFEYTI